MDTKPTVLVIDDNPDALEILRTLLEEHGYRALVAPDGSQGLALARAERPDCIILDIMMPEMSGFQVCQSLKADPACERTPILVLTARKLDRDRSYARTVGADDFLTKPVRPAQLLAAIQKHLAGAARPQPTRQLGMRRILAIASDPAFVRVVSGAMEAYNFLRKTEGRYDLANVPTLADARPLLAQQPPAAILVDARAQNEGAEQIVRRLKTDPKTKPLPLVVVRHERGEDLKFAWADVRLPGQPSGKDIVAAITSLVER